MEGKSINTMAQVRLERLTKVYPNHVTAVQDLTLAAGDGELLVLMGPSGCGKTTTLRLVAGLEKATHGTIRIGGLMVNSWPAHRRNVAMVFQRPALYPHLTVKQNLAFSARLQGKLNPARLKEVIEALRLKELLDRRPAELSGGEQQRVALGKAIVRQPAVFLLDEPLSNLDAPLRREMRHELHLLHRRFRATMVYVTHDQAEAMSLGDRVAVLNAGQLQQIDTPAQLYRRPANRFVASWVGSPAMNFMDGEVFKDKDGAWFGKRDCCLPLPPAVQKAWAVFCGRPLTVGIRPENVIIVRPALRPSQESSRASLQLAVGLKDMMGKVGFVTLRRDDWLLVARFDEREVAWASLPEGQMIEADLEMDQSYLFDGVTGMALCHPESG
jgi:multiple sugar transport system ATP-binding protein